jgi:hypothetical protein
MYRKAIDSSCKHKKLQYKNEKKVGLDLKIEETRTHDFLESCKLWR